MLKYIIGSIIIIALCFVAVFFVFGLFDWNWDIPNWSVFQRAAATLLSIICCIGTNVIYWGLVASSTEVK